MIDKKALELLRERFTAEPVPPCRVCGRKLSIASAGGGRATEYACADREKREGQMDDWYDHYGQSKFRHIRDGDPYVLELLDSFEELQKRLEGLTD